MKTYTAIIAALTFSFVGNTAVADLPNSDLAESATPQAQVVIYRPQADGRTGYINYRVSIDGKRLGRFKAGTFYLLDVSPGAHSIKSSDRGAQAIEFFVGENETLVLQGEVAPNYSMIWTEVDGRQAVEAAPFLADALPEIEAGDYTLWVSIER